jgi:DNA-directed RNA polymerase specialized sigma24 family protein
MLSLLWSQAVYVLGSLVFGALPAPDAAGGAPDDVARLVARIQAGDHAAEAELVARFSQGLLLMLRRLVQNPALADDLHQETLSLVLEKIRRAEVREPEKLAGFIRSTARNLFIADRRKEARYRPMDDGEEEGARPLPGLVDRRPAPLDRVLANEEAR